MCACGWGWGGAQGATFLARGPSAPAFSGHTDSFWRPFGLVWKLRFLFLPLVSLATWKTNTHSCVTGSHSVFPANASPWKHSRTRAPETQTRSPYSSSPVSLCASPSQSGLGRRPLPGAPRTQGPGDLSSTPRPASPRPTWEVSAPTSSIPALDLIAEQNR